MAVAFTPNLDDEDEKMKQAQLSGQSGTIGGGQAAPSTPAGSSSGRWTNMMSYVDANKDSGMGQKVEDKVSGQVNDSVSGLDTAGKVCLDMLLIKVLLVSLELVQTS